MSVFSDSTLYLFWHMNPFVFLANDLPVVSSSQKTQLTAFKLSPYLSLSSVWFDALMPINRQVYEFSSARDCIVQSGCLLVLALAAKQDCSATFLSVKGELRRICVLTGK